MGTPQNANTSSKMMEEGGGSAYTSEDCCGEYKSCIPDISNNGLAWIYNIYNFVLGDPISWFTDLLCMKNGRAFKSSTDEKAISYSNWLWNTIYLMIKEYTAVLFQLVCFSRVQLPDFFTGAFITYVMLVTLGFPFMNSYLFFLLRLGPWTTDINTPGLVAVYKNFIQILLVIAMHLSAAKTASDFLTSYDHIWMGSSMSQIDMNGTQTPVSWIFYSVDDAVDIALPGVEEGLNSLFFLVGLLNIMEADAGKYMSSAYWNTEQQPTDSINEISTGNIMEGINNLKTTLETGINILNDQVRSINTGNMDKTQMNKDTIEKYEIKEETDKNNIPKNTSTIKLNPLPRKQIEKINGGRPLNLNSKLIANYNFDNVSLRVMKKRTDNDGKLFTHHSAVPINFIVHVCILIAAISRAFPTAHGTPAITLFLYLRGVCTGSVANSRIIGGSIGTLLALMYYYIFHVWAGRIQTPIPEKFIKSVIVDEPAYLYSELQLPKHMIVADMKNKMNSE
jgi:hypothetical protein